MAAGAHVHADGPLGTVSEAKERWLHSALIEDDVDHVDDHEQLQSEDCPVQGSKVVSVDQLLSVGVAEKDLLSRV